MKLTGLLVLVLVSGCSADPCAEAIDRARLYPAPGRSFELDIPVVDGLTMTRRRVETLCRKLVWSPAVEMRGHW